MRWRATNKKVGISAKKVQKKCQKSVQKKIQKQDPEPANTVMYYSLKQKSEGYFSVPKKKRARSDRPPSTEDLKMSEMLVPLQKITKIPDKQTSYKNKLRYFWKRSGGRNKRCAQLKGDRFLAPKTDRIVNLLRNTQNKLFQG